MDSPTGVRAIIHKRAVRDRCRTTIGVERPASQYRGVRNECAVTDGE